MKKLQYAWTNMGFQKKLLCISLIVSIIPILVLCVFSYWHLKKRIIQHEEIIVEESLRAENERIGQEMNSVLIAFNQILCDNNLEEALSREYHTVSEMYVAYRDDIDPLFLTIQTTNPIITNICIYTDHSIFPHGSILRSLEEAQDMPWYEAARSSLDTIYTVSKNGKELYLAYKMHRYSSETSIICMSIDLNRLFNAPSSIIHGISYEYEVVDGNDTVLFSRPTVHLTDNNSTGAGVEDAQNNIIREREISLLGYTMVIRVPYSEIWNIIRPILISEYIVFMLCVGAVVLLSFLLSNKVVTPLKQLTESMALVENGRYDITLEYSGNDELGMLVKSFNKMTSELDRLINRVLRQDIEEKKYRLKIFQLQINPHFLYNSLSLINSRAIQRGQKDIAQISQLLSTFYRTMLNQGDFVITIQKEVENVKAYIQIQQMMHDGSFDVVYDIDEELFPCKIPNMILQPLAENAIIHGLDQKTTIGKGILSICGYRDNDEIILKVMDNGCGMSEELRQSVLAFQSKGYGINNVNQRIQLFYGEPYGMEFKSTIQQGTSAIIRIPWQKNSEDLVIKG